MYYTGMENCPLILPTINSIIIVLRLCQWNLGLWKKSYQEDRATPQSIDQGLLKLLCVEGQMIICSLARGQAPRAAV